MTPKTKRQAQAEKAREAYKNKIKEEAWREMANFLEEKLDFVESELDPHIRVRPAMAHSTARLSIQSFMELHGIYPKNHSLEAGRNSKGEVVWDARKEAA